ncbi:MAG: class I SAM-dependent methyltransferase [Eubacterium sp.]
MLESRKDQWVEKWKDAAETSAYRKTFSNKYECQCWDASADYYDAGMGSSEERLRVVLDRLEHEGFFKGAPKTVLDIGSGTGSFALPLSERGALVTTIDCSAEMNHIMAEKAKKRGLKLDIRTGEFDQVSFGAQKYDLVLGSMNPGLYHPDPFGKMLSLSKGRIIYIGICEQPLKQKDTPPEKTLDDELLGYRLSHAGSNLVNYPYQILSAMGYKPSVVPVKCEWHDLETEEMAVKRLTRHYETLTGFLQGVRVQEKIKAYVKRHLKNGFFMNEGETTMGILFCTLNNEAKKMTRMP